MDKSTLMERINQKQIQIEKLVRLYDKYSKQATDEEIVALCNQFLRTGDRTAIRGYFKTHPTWTVNYDLYSTADKLYDARLTLEKYLNMLKAIEERESVEKISTIWEFLLSYKAMVKQWLYENASVCDEYYEEESKYCDMVNSRKYSREELNAQWANVKELKDDIHPWTSRYYRPWMGWNEEGLEKELNKDIENRYFKLINQVTKYCGEIIDVSNLSIHYGDLNGIVIGTKGKCKIQTIGAGGYNIQCFHYRTLVKAVK